MKPAIYIPYSTLALDYASGVLNRRGFRLTQACEEAEYLLYPAPTSLPTLCDYYMGKTVIGGNLDFLKPEVERYDLLKDPHYLAANAAITAEAALGMILTHLPCEVSGADILILGWGRIGKCLTHQLKVLNTRLWVYARKDCDRAMLRALGYHPVTLEELQRMLPKFRCIVNTAPAPVLTAEDAMALRSDCYKLDLASVLSIPGENVVHARGLPGRCKPEASGLLIGQCVAEHLEGGGV